MQTVSEHSSLYRKAQQAAQCGRSPKAAASQRGRNRTPVDFLRHAFLPLYEDCGETLPDKDETEQRYFESLETLQSRYGISTLDVGQKAYPYNLLLSSWDAEAKMKRLHPLVDIHISGGRFAIPTGQRLSVGHTLYYIPVKPLCLLMGRKGKRNRQVAELLLSVFAYLHIKAAVPFYTDEDSFIKWQYETLRDWIAEDTEDEDGENLDELEAAFSYGEMVKNEMRLDSHLSQFGRRIREFKAIKGSDRELIKMAKGFYGLWNGYPCYNIFSHLVPSQTEDENEVIRMEQYISFVADLEGNLSITLFDMINNTFSECSEMDEPVTLSLFGKDGQLSEDSFDYERRLFGLMDELCYQLNNLL